MAVAPDLASRLTPDLETARALVPESNVVPVALRYTDDVETPVSALLKLRQGGPCFLLESAERGQVGRYSFVGVGPHRVIRWVAGELKEFPGEAMSGEGAPIATFPAADPYDGVKEYLSRYRVAETPGMPPFAGGAVGLFGYDLVRAIEPLGDPNPDPLGLPDLALMITDVLLAFDHLHNELTIISCAWADEHENFDQAWEAAAERIGAVRESLRGPVPDAGETGAVEAP
ncbi:MAG TPA: anthranilate synthase component I, partial [Solirubrobacterales bacterium]|nr:anthranilate synthase component I [Solirubrobacterales bacterium]